MGVLLCEMAQRPVTASEIPGHCHPITRYTRQRNHRNVANTFVITVILAYLPIQKYQNTMRVNYDR